MKIAFCSSEIFPFAKTGGLADVTGALPLALEARGEEVVLFLPKYKCVNFEDYSVEKVAHGVFKSVIGKNIEIYFIENEKYFGRDELYGDVNGDFDDNLERFQYFCLQVLKIIKKLRFKIDIIHCHDWQTALIPVYLKEKFSCDEFYRDIRTVLTIHNLAFQGTSPKKKYSKLGLKKELFNSKVFEFYGQVNLLKSGIVYAHAVTTVSKQYAKEIKTKEFGCGLEDVLLSRRDNLKGIVNGLDYKVWDPQTDDLIDTKYSNGNIDFDKLKNKKWLQKETGLKVSKDIPIFGFVGRLSHQKGIDLIIDSLKELLKLDIEIVVQGVGEEKYYKKLNKFAKANPKKIALCFEFNEHLAHQIYAGSDMFLMPSIFEPCGLSQMIAFRYGTIPIVYKTGGLIDTVIPYDDLNNKGNGFIFDKYEKDAFVGAVNEAINVFKQKEKFHKLVENALSVCFSWEKSAKKYQNLYKKLLKFGTAF